MVSTVGLVLHPQRDSKEAIDTIVEWARKRDCTVLGLPDEVGRIDCSAIAVDAPTLVRRSDLLVSLGGDGTMLRTMRLIAGRPTPVLGSTWDGSVSSPRSTWTSWLPRCPRSTSTDTPSSRAWRSGRSPTTAGW